MKTIVAKQHFYSSVPPEVTGRGGGQTFARSAGLDVLEEVEDSCYYDLYAEDADALYTTSSVDLPVNWGWFPSGSDYVCVQRVGDAGTDDIGRPGNFLCHNLVFPNAALEQIDYDIPCLIEWVRRNSPFRYERPDKTDDGFARRYRQVCQQLGLKYVQDEDFSSEQRKLLQTFPEMEIPVDEVRDLRVDVDRRWEQDFYEPVCEQLGAETLNELLQALLCPSKEFRPVILTGFGSGRRESADEFRLIALLFSLLPYHCRRKLPFATYFFAEHINVDDASTSHCRALFILHDYSSVDRLSTSDEQVVTIHGGGKKESRLPGESTAFRVYRKLLQENNSRQLFRLRDFASHFGFVEIAPGLKIAIRLMQLTQDNSFEETDRPFFAEGVHTLRRYCPALLKIGQRLLAWTLATGNASAEPFEDDAALLLEMLQRQSELHEETDAEVPVEGVGKILFKLITQGFELGCLQLAGRCLRQTMESTLLESCRESLLPQTADLVERKMERTDVDDVLAVWKAVDTADEQRVSESPACSQFVNRIAKHLCGQLLQGARSRPPGGDVDPAVLALLEARPIEDFGHLELIIQFLMRVSSQLTDEEIVETVGGFLGGLIEKGQLKPQFIERLCNERAELLLTFYPEWCHAAESAPALTPLLQPVLQAPILLAQFWETPQDRQTSVLRRSVRRAVAAFSEGATGQEPLKQFEEAYRQTGVLRLTEQVRRLTVDPPEEAATFCDVVRTQQELLAFAKQAAGENAGESQSVRRKHLANLLTAAVCYPWAEQDVADRSICVESLVDTIQHECPKLSERNGFFTDVGRLLAEESGQPELDVLSEQLEGTFETDEVHWLVFLVEEFRVRRSPFDPKRDWPELFARFFVQYPVYGGIVHRGGPECGSLVLQNLRKKIKQSGTEVWERVRTILLDDFHNADDIAPVLEKWFGADSPLREHMVPVLESVATDSKESLLHEAGEQIANAYDRVQPKPLRALGQILLFPDLPDAVEKPVEKKLAELLPAAINDWGQKRDRRLPTDTLFKSEKTACDLAPAVLKVADTLDDADLREYLKFVGEALPRFTPQYMQRFYPSIAGLIRHAHRQLGSQSDESDGWKLVFRTLANQDDRSDFVSHFIAAGESVVEDKHRYVEGLCGYLEVYRSLFIQDVFPDDKEHDADLLVDLLKQAPDGADSHNGRLETRAEVLQSRARFAAEVFFPDQRKTTRALAGIYDQLGRVILKLPTRIWRAENTAVAIAAFVTADGADKEAVWNRGRHLLRRRFVKHLEHPWRSKDDQVALREQLERSLQLMEVEPKTAAAFATKFYQKLGGVFGRLRR